MGVIVRSKNVTLCAKRVGKFERMTIYLRFIMTDVALIPYFANTTEKYVSIVISFEMAAYTSFDRISSDVISAFFRER